jgi:hypothetical protein
MIKANLKIPIIIDTVSGDDGYEINDFITNFKVITGIKLKKKSLDKGYGSSREPWLLYVKKDKDYIAILEKELANNF